MISNTTLTCSALDAFIWTHIFSFIQRPAILALRRTCKIFNTIIENNVCLRAMKYKSVSQCFKKNDRSAILYIIEYMRVEKQIMGTFMIISSLCVQNDDIEIFKSLTCEIKTDPYYKMGKNWATIIGKGNALRILSEYMRFCENPYSFVASFARLIIKNTSRPKQCDMAKYLLTLFNTFKSGDVLDCVCKYSIKSNNLNMFRIVIRLGHYSLLESYAFPNEKFVELIRNNGLELNTYAANSAVKHNRVAVLSAVHDAGLLNAFDDHELCTLAAAYNSFECLKFLHEHNQPWDWHTYGAATKENNQRCVDYLIAQGCPTSRPDDASDSDEDVNVHDLIQGMQD